MSPPPAVCYRLARYRSHRRAGRQARAALAAAGMRLVERPQEADVVVLHDEPWTYPGHWRAFPELAHRPVVGYAVWEPDRVPAAMARWLAMPDEIWTASRFCRDILAVAGTPVRVVPHVVDPPPAGTATVAALAARLGLSPPRFVFYLIGRLEERKNVAAAVAAFAAAFPAGGPALVVKTPTPLPAELAAVPGVVAWPGAAGDDEIAALHGLGHCCVSAHRAEGWGLCLSDAMAAGNLVVATGYGGNTDFMTAENALPVAWRHVAIDDPQTRERFGFAPADTPGWAAVEHDALVAALRRAHDEWPALAPLRAAARQVATRFSPAAVGTAMAGHVARLAARARRAA
ncbi:hypothetical protein N1F89_17260 [Aquibium sp. A9E412]|uniref:glycosyltransferase n=1 Tax=Aquibium sp. A9E412 TaxID=2976767 RepID=UPI0025AF8FF9|nr:glycosyltransferase [Aquibium sp. A9E412]MDN2567975.1 hypothetical protein [Aquibium sp. A9E412]